MQLSSEDIKTAIRTGNDDEVLDFLYKDTLPVVRNYVMVNSGTMEEADDLFQDAVLYLYNMVYDNKIPDIKNIGGFIFRAAKNSWINKAKKNRRKIPLENTYELVDYGVDSLSIIIDEEKQDALNSLFDKIGEVCKQVMTMQVYQRLSMEEIAMKMNLGNANAAKAQNYRCKKKLAELVTQEPHILALLKP